MCLQSFYVILLMLRKINISVMTWTFTVRWRGVLGSSDNPDPWRNTFLTSTQVTSMWPSEETSVFMRSVAHRQYGPLEAKFCFLDLFIINAYLCILWYAKGLFTLVIVEVGFAFSFLTTDRILFVDFVDTQRKPSNCLPVVASLCTHLWNCVHPNSIIRVNINCC